MKFLYSYQSMVFRALTLLLLGCSASVYAAVDCTPESIELYLQKGFSHDQVVKLCSEPEEAKTSVSTQINRTQINPESEPMSQREMEFYFTTKIKANDLKLTSQYLSFTSKECFQQGDSEMIIYNDRVCGLIRTELKLPGLEIVNAEKGAFVFRDTELLVKTDINRSVVNADKMHGKSLKLLQKLLDTTPEQYNIPLRDDVDPEQVASRLIQY